MHDTMLERVCAGQVYSGCFRFLNTCVTGVHIHFYVTIFMCSMLYNIILNDLNMSDVDEQKINLMVLKKDGQ